MKFVFKSSLFAVVAIALASLTSCNVFAADLDVPVRLYTTSNYLSGSYMPQGSTSTVSVGGGVFNNAIIATQIRMTYTNMAAFDGLYLDAPFYVYNYNENNSVDGYMNILNVSCNNGNIACQIAGTSYDGGGSGQIYHVYIYVSGSGTLNNLQLYNTQANSFALRLYDSERCQPLPLVGYRLVDNSTDMSTVNTYVQYMSSQLDTLYARLNVLSDIQSNGALTNTKLEQLKAATEDMAEQEERIADVAEDEYNKTLEDEETASSGASGFSFNFTLPNPFSIFQVSDGCVNTPTIDSWLHLSGDWKSPHCPLIPANVRSVLTPVVTLIVTLATLLVLIRWVSSSAVDVAGNSSSLIDKPNGGKK